jgi:DedD protein
MDKALKQRLVGASVLIIFAVIVLPMLLSGRSETLNTESRQIELPSRPEELSFETRRFPVGVPDKATPPAVEQTASDDAVEEIANADLPTPQPDADAPITEKNTDAATDLVEDAVEKPPAVTTVIIKPEEKAPAITPDPVINSQASGRYLVQVASFSNVNSANALAADLRVANMPVAMDVVDRTGGRLHRVRVGPYGDRSDADSVVAKISSMNQDLSPRIMDTRPDEGAPVSAPTDPLVRWVVQVGSYNSASTAESEVAKLRLNGLTAYSEKVTSESGIAYKVRIGPEINRPAAVQLAKDIKTQHNINGFVTTQE